MNFACDYSSVFSILLKNKEQILCTLEQKPKNSDLGRRYNTQMNGNVLRIQLNRRFLGGKFLANTDIWTKNFLKYIWVIKIDKIVNIYPWMGTLFALPFSLFRMLILTAKFLFSLYFWTICWITDKQRLSCDKLSKQDLNLLSFFPVIVRCVSFFVETSVMYIKLHFNTFLFRELLCSVFGGKVVQKKKQKKTKENSMCVFVCVCPQNNFQQINFNWRNKLLDVFVFLFTQLVGFLFAVPPAYVIWMSLKLYENYLPLAFPYTLVCRGKSSIMHKGDDDHNKVYWLTVR